MPKPISEVRLLIDRDSLQGDKLLSVLIVKPIYSSDEESYYQTLGKITNDEFLRELAKKLI